MVLDWAYTLELPKVFKKPKSFDHVEFWKHSLGVVYLSRTLVIHVGGSKEDVEANVKQIAFFHHEPTYNDAKLVDIFRQTEKYLKLVAPKQDLKMFLSYEGLSVDLLKDH